MLKHILKKIYFYSFIFVTVFFGGCGGGEHSDSFGISSLKNSLLNLVDSHSNNLTSIPSGGLYVFVTSYTNSSSVSPLTHNGNFARISGADAYCNSHIPSGLPGTGSYKAMLVDGINRVATTVGANSSSGQKDWVFEKILRITDRMGSWYSLQMTLGFLISLREVLVRRSPILFIFGILEFGPGFNPIGKLPHLRNFVLPGLCFGQTEIRPFKEGSDMRITSVELLYRRALFLVSGKKPRIRILREVWRWEFFVYRKSPLHLKRRSVF